MNQFSLFLLKRLSAVRKNGAKLKFLIVTLLLAQLQLKVF